MGAEIRFESRLDGIDWVRLKKDLSADDFDNGRTPDELRRSFTSSHAVAIAWNGGRVVGTARILADGVCNAYLVDVWTASEHRRRGIGSTMVKELFDAVPGHHVGLFTEDHIRFYASLGFEAEHTGMSLIAGLWLNRFTPKGSSSSTGAP